MTKRTNRGPRALERLLTIPTKPSKSRATRDTLHVIDGETGAIVRSTDVTGKTKAERDAVGREMMEHFSYDRYFTRLNDGKDD